MSNMIDRKNIILIAAAILIFAVIGVVIPYLQIRNQKDKTPGQQESGSGTIVQIDYTNSGFVPKSVSIKPGTTVSWTNKSGRPMWVASDPHPSHTNLPGFDATDTILPGPLKKRGLIKSAFAHHSLDNTYQYAFLNIGKWSYHNHIYAADRGEIIVTE